MVSYNSNSIWQNFFLQTFFVVFAYFSLGMRYSTLLIKAAIAEVVSHFEISVNPRTKQPIIVHPKDFLYLHIHDIFLDYKLLS